MNLDVNGMGEGAGDGRGACGRDVKGSRKSHCNP